MSIAGIRSNRGDGYQTLVAFNWALFVLSDPEFQWLEVDSVLYGVDDVVVGKIDGTQICCQCKKNHIDFRAWSIADLADELSKASRLLAKNLQAEIRFYSRSPFGELAKLREHSTTQGDESSYLSSLGTSLRKVDSNLRAQIAIDTPSLSTYDFLRRTSFENSPELDRMEALLYERLRNLAANPKVAFDALWALLDKLGARMDSNSACASTQHRISKQGLKEALHRAGTMLAPTMDIAEVRTAFASASSIGRSWHREISGHRISNKALSELLEAIDSGKRAVLLTGLPGSGKTCVMLDLQEALEKRALTHADLVPLFIQSREYADLATARDRESLGLPEHWVERAARMSETARVVVVIDSLDVLAIAREHSVLTYFLAQIDRLLLISNITVITACREFDRHYDRRIADRQWDFQVTCHPLNWDSEVVPLLEALQIDVAVIDTVTRELIRNPRELALFVELARKEGGFSVITSHALAQRYLDTIVRSDSELGDSAMKAIEGIASEMLKTRSLAVPRQRFIASQNIQRMLCSLNVLQETQDEKLSFGHQTLLDVLVISGSVRRGITLSDFIGELPLVPFVRPSIRSFVMQLAMGERREFRKQLRTVLTGDAAFHIRRLVAEVLAEQPPQDGDWPLILDLHQNHRDVFQVIYIQGRQVEWNRFWSKNLVPSLKEARDVDGLLAHIQRTAIWKREDTASVLTFWSDALTLDWLDKERVAGQLGNHLAEIDLKHSALVRPLIEKILTLPQERHNHLGLAIARFVATDSSGDKLLWRYIAGDINDTDLTGYRFDEKLRCKPHLFGRSNNTFLLQRMAQSDALLSMAVETIECWSRKKSTLRNNPRIGFRSTFLQDTSHNDLRSQTDHRHISSERVLFDAVEAAVRTRAETSSEWWALNRERMCFNDEGALRYIAILACISAPQDNLDLVSRMLCDSECLESDLSYELSNLIQVAFIYLDDHAQDDTISAILSIWASDEDDEVRRPRIVKARADLIAAIPCHLRSAESQSVIDEYERAQGRVFRRPNIHSRGGMVSAPFSFEIFLSTTDHSVLRLLSHYSGYERTYDDFLIGGEREVGMQLREAASRHPIRFLLLLSMHWAEISGHFCDQILDGVATYLLHRHGNLQTSGTWAPHQESDAQILASQILDELERHPAHWHLNRAASNALQACSHVIQDLPNAERLVRLSIGFESVLEESSISGDAVDLLTAGINMMTGHVTEALMILANSLLEHHVPLPELLPHALRRFAKKDHPAIRALILRRLPYMQSMNPDLGWDLMHMALQDSSGLWESAEQCLYYSYHVDFGRVSSLLDRIPSEGTEKDFETWGRISALAALSNHLTFSSFVQDLNKLDATSAWRGAATVWTNVENINQHREHCFAGIEAGLNARPSHAIATAEQMNHVFRESNAAVSIPSELVQLCFAAFENEGRSADHYLFGIEEWLNAISNRYPEQALATAETYLGYFSRTKSFLYDHENRLTQLMTRLFSEAEEREESDGGAFLRRVVSLQDMLLSLGVSGISEWLRAAERQ